MYARWNDIPLLTGMQRLSDEVDGNAANRDERVCRGRTNYMSTSNSTRPHHQQHSLELSSQQTGFAWLKSSVSVSLISPIPQKAHSPARALGKPQNRDRRARHANGDVQAVEDNPQQPKELGRTGVARVLDALAALDRARVALRHAGRAGERGGEGGEEEGEEGEEGDEFREDGRAGHGCFGVVGALVKESGERTNER